MATTEISANSIDGRDEGHGNKALRILIAGAGIGGLTAALALRQQGHEVDIFEQSKLAQETGAAIHIASNCNGLLRRLGLKVEDIGAVECGGVVEFRPDGGTNYAIDLSKMPKMWAHPWHLVHRAHLHTALKDMATGETGPGIPVKLHVARPVKSTNPEAAKVTLEDGTEYCGDLVVGADGVHSRTRSSISGGDLKPFDSGKSAFRFLLPTELLSRDPNTAHLVTKLWLTMWIGENKRLIQYPCVSGTMFNYVAIHPSSESEADISGEGWQETGSKSRMLQIFKDFEPAVQSILEKANETQLKVWKLLDMAKMPSFTNCRLAVIGDAAHPFLPHQGQGGGQAIEDAVCLAAVLPLGTRDSEVPDRLKLFEQCRYERAHTIQEYTRTAGKDAVELAAEGQKLDMMEYQAYNFGHDAWDFASHILQKHLEAQDPSLRFRSPYGFGPSPGPRRPLNLSLSHPSVQAHRKKSLESSKTYTIRFKSSRTYLQNLLPPGFAFTSPATLVSVSIICTTLNGLKWLGGREGYSHLGLYVHGIHYTKRDGSKTYGTYLPVLFEDLADPIITGREELGFPKLFASIHVDHKDTDDCSIVLSWEGNAFGMFELRSLRRQEHVLDGGPGVDKTTHTPPSGRGPGPPPPPPEEGILVYRYVPAVGEPEKTDAEYAVLAPYPVSTQMTVPSEKISSSAVSIHFDAKDWQSLPTLHHIVKVLEGIPVYSIEKAEMTRAIGVDDLSTAHKIE